MTVLAIVLLAIASVVALLNIAGVYSAMQWKRKGISRGYSCVAGVSLVLCISAWAMASDTVGAWAIIPTLFDPGTWSIVVLPFFLVYEAFKKP